MQEFDYEYAEFIYYTPRNLDKESQFWPIRGGRSTGKPNYKVGPKRIECYSLHLVQEGELVFEYQNHKVTLGPNHLFCLFPGVTYHYSISATNSPLRLCWVAMDGPRIRALLELAGLTPETPYTYQADCAPLEQTMEQILGHMRNASDWRAAVSLELQSLLFALFAGITPDAGERHFGEEPAGWIQECIDFMELHATEGVSVQQVASFAGLNRSYFSGVFAREVGMSPHSYLQKIRMEKAKRLLRETEATVTEIALSLGYPNLFSFTRAFKNYCKIAPVLFRSRL
ncbi:AraC family transcriptional regulator [Paenibacillus doosanensis]|uniref:AraC family transcriptional regulator n=1 Tax=Paenibacillus doosanensis TaxID=1229154 RepID=UPI00217FF70E|nr:AraC family transcriptional regulator [Paenibacillus doosanensis]MCS7460604.1 AraC family transcriptional regulator [Paenibacillus doosanensis]